MTRCFNCMKEYDEKYDMCPFCGYMNDSQPEKSYQLLPGTMLENRYTIGIVIGFVGSCIFYRAWDNKLNAIVTIKECYPSGLVNRSPGQTKVTLVGDQAMKNKFRTHINRFLDEAQTMARLKSCEYIVCTIDYFEDNNTAYQVIEYISASNLKTYLNVLTVEQSVRIILNICSALKLMHKQKIIHGHINLYNIVICDDNRIKLIIDYHQIIKLPCKSSLSVILTEGYSAPELYEKNGQIGAWTEVYAVCATLYRMITGITPIDPVDRSREDKLISPISVNPNVSDQLNRIVLDGMQLNYRKRTSNMDTLIKQLMSL